MSRKPNQPAEHISTTTDAHDATISASANELVAIQNQHSAEVSQLATQLGYDGDLSVGSLEDSIRFYQKQEMDVWLSLGKRLLLLKEQVGHGEFQTRIELLGFGYRTAARYMQAAVKSTKSATVALLANQVKSFRAFSEIIMVDDEDTLKKIAELDDIDRMPASELRKAVRELKANGEATDKLLAAKDKKLNELKRKGQAVAFTDGCHVFSTVIEQIDQVRRQMNLSLGMLDEQISAALAVEIEEVDMPAAAHAYEALAQAINDALTEPQSKIDKATKRFETFISPLADAALAA